MSTALLNTTGDTVAIKFYGGAERGLCLQVKMTEAEAEQQGRMKVREQGQEPLMTLTDYLTSIAIRKGTITYQTLSGT